jgi:hypothetical protein
MQLLQRQRGRVATQPLHKGELRGQRGRCEIHDLWRAEIALSHLESRKDAMESHFFIEKRERQRQMMHCSRVSALSLMAQKKKESCACSQKDGGLPQSSLTHLIESAALKQHQAKFGRALAG